MRTLYAPRRAPAPAWRLAPLLLLLACAPKTRPAALTPAVPTLYAGLLQPQAPGAPAGPIPRAVQDEATRLLVVRGLTPTVLPDAALRERVQRVLADPVQSRVQMDVLAGGACPACSDVDFNNNGVFPEDQDVTDFFNVLAGGSCP